MVPLKDMYEDNDDDRFCPIDPYETPDILAERKDLVEFIVEKSGLSKGEKEALRSSYLSGKTPTEAAKERGLSDGLVHTQCSYAKPKIRAALNRERLLSHNVENL